MYDGVAVDQPVEEFPQRRQVELLGRDGDVQLLEILADAAGRDVEQLQPVMLAQARNFRTACM